MEMYYGTRQSSMAVANYIPEGLSLILAYKVECMTFNAATM